MLNSTRAAIGLNPGTAVPPPPTPRPPKPRIVVAATFQVVTAIVATFTVARS